jgi:hypothetical protein
MGSSTSSPTSRRTPTLHVRTADGRVFRFSKAFHVGRESDCDVRIEHARVSRKHVLVSYVDSCWQIRDLNSSNGVFLAGRPVEVVSVTNRLTITLGEDGPLLTFVVEQPNPPADRGARGRSDEPPVSETRIAADYAERYFGSKTQPDEVGGRTRMIRKAFQDLQKKQRRKYGWTIAAAALATVVAGGYAYYGHRQISQQRAVAEELFYAMKSLDVDMANMEQLVASSGNTQSQLQLKSYQERRRQMESTYDKFLAASDVYDRTLTEQERLILRVTRAFGECEIAAPPEYLTEVASYIRKWQSSGRFARAVTLGRQMGYTKRIAQEFLQHNLPPQFVYLAMQESDFDPFISGPPTYMGIAKGMWQFIPETGARYGLTIGPLVKVRKPDPADDRHNWEKATEAAARYIKDIYSTDAQASGLLVMASYNWGERRVINLLRSMPANPKERNFWKVLSRHRNQLPKETYDYVFYIVAAAVIGENPRLFGFSFDSPLAASVTARRSSPQQS